MSKNFLRLESYKDLGINVSDEIFVYQTVTHFRLFPLLKGGYYAEMSCVCVCSFVRSFLQNGKNVF